MTSPASSSRPLLSRLARPRIGRHSTYTVLGFCGYFAAVALGVCLADRWQLPLADRLIGFLVPPSAFILTVAIATVIKGREWIVFYQALGAALFSVLGISVLAGTTTARLIDLTVLGIGTFLVLGRLGCFHVACCHGTPLGPWAERNLSSLAVRYGEAHVAVGFWRRWRDRPLVPVQLLEAAATIAWMLVAVAASAEAGRAASIFMTGYACTRFILELWRGDPVRPHALGLSEAQWASLVALLVVAALWLAVWTWIAFAATAITAIFLILRRQRRELVLPPHLHELDALARSVFADPSHERRDSSLGVGLSYHQLTDGRHDWILSASHRAWSPVTAERIARALWPNAQRVAGRTPGVIHFIEPAQDTDAT